MLKKPQFKPCFRVEVIPSQGIFLLSETNSFFLSGSIYERIFPLINGQRTVDEIAQQLQGKVSLPEVYYSRDRARNSTGDCVSCTATQPPLAFEF